MGGDVPQEQTPTTRRKKTMTNSRKTSCLEQNHPFLISEPRTTKERHNNSGQKPLGLTWQFRQQGYTSDQQ